MKSVFKGLNCIVLLILLASCTSVAQTPTVSSDAYNVQVAVAVSLTQTAAAIEAPAQPPASATQSTAATSQPVATATPEATATSVIVHVLEPGAPTSGWTTITDTSSAAMASQKRAPGGEDYNLNRFERPFTSGNMVYHPEVDIQTAKLGYDNNFYYVDIAIQGVNPDTNQIDATYAVELDADKDGRGDYMVIAKPPFGNDWVTTTAWVGQDANHDVGGPHPLTSDAPYRSDGYETILFNNGQGQDPDLAWARLSPDKTNTVEIAFKRSLLPTGEFMWGVWADNGNSDLSLQDINDRFTSQEAGTSIYGLSYYPLAKVALLDNTCRWTFGFTSTGKEPGLCAGSLPPGHINAFLYFDSDNNATYNNPPDTPATFMTDIMVYSGTSCSGTPVQTQTVYDTFSSTALAAGKYCIHLNAIYDVVSNDRVVTVNSGANTEADFALQYH